MSNTTQKLERLLYFKHFKGQDAEVAELLIELMKDHKKYTAEEKNQIAQSLTDNYRERNGHDMRPALLEGLADFILSDTLLDKRINKVQIEEYPILSERQLTRRDRREQIVEADTMDYFNNMERFSQKKSHGDNYDTKE